MREGYTHTAYFFIRTAHRRAPESIAAGRSARAAACGGKGTGTRSDFSGWIPAVIQRKVTNGYRAMWAAEGEADICTVGDTARVPHPDPWTIGWAMRRA